MSVSGWITAAAMIAAAIGSGVSEEATANTREVALHAGDKNNGDGALARAFAADEGMLSEIAETALSAAGLTEAPRLNAVAAVGSPDLTDAASNGGVIFPVYKPRCDDTHLLTEHTSLLCSGFKWSAPLFHVITAGYVAETASWSPRSNSDLIGKTICQVDGDLVQFMRQRGLTHLNSRLITAPSASACLKLVVEGASDIAVLPMSSAHEAFADVSLRDKIRHAPALDSVLTVHAIAAQSDPVAIADIFALNEGLAQIRANGVWFDIVKRRFSAQSRIED